MIQSAKGSQRSVSSSGGARRVAGAQDERGPRCAGQGFVSARARGLPCWKPGWVELPEYPNAGINDEVITRNSAFEILSVC